MPAQEPTLVGQAALQLVSGPEWVAPAELMRVSALGSVAAHRVGYLAVVELLAVVESAVRPTQAGPAAPRG